VNLRGEARNLATIVYQILLSLVKRLTNLKID